MRTSVVLSIAAALTAGGDAPGHAAGYEVFAGNRTDVTTVEEIVATMEARYGRAGRVWVMDRGMTSARTSPGCSTAAPLPDRR